MSECAFRLEHVDVDFALYGVDARSLRKQVITAGTGGLIAFSSGSDVLVQALRDINLTITSGERVGLVGHNGAGKSTLLRVLAGAYEPVRGTMHRVGRTTALFDLWSGFSYEATGMENILLRGLYLGIDRETLLARRDAIIEFSELGSYIHLPIHAYSAGMVMRLAFAVSTAVATDVLLMDEWLTVGDPAFQARCQQRMLDLVGGSGIVVLATHAMPILERVCTRLIWLEAGRVRADGPLREVKAAFDAAQVTQRPSASAEPATAAAAPDSGS